MRFHRLLLLAFQLVPATLFAQPTTERPWDSLPDGAVTLLGSSRLRHPGAADANLRLAFSPDGRMLVSANSAGVATWDVRTGRRMSWLAAPRLTSVGALAVSPDNKAARIAFGADLGWVRLADGAGQLTDGAPRDSSPPVEWLAFVPGGNALIVIESRGRIRLFDPDPDSLPLARSYGNPHPLAGISHDGKTLTIWNQDKVERWAVSGMQKTASVKFPYLGLFRKLRLRKDGSLFAINLDAGGVLFWDPIAGKEAGRLADVNLVVDAGMDFTNDGKKLVTVSRRRDEPDATVRAWDVASGKLEKQFAIPALLAADPVIAPDGHTVAFAASRPFIPIWDLETGQPKFEQGGFDVAPAALAFLPGRRLVGVAGPQICAWDLTNSKLLNSILLPFNSAGLAVDPAGRWVVAAGDGSLAPRQCDLSSGRIAKLDIPRATSLIPGAVAASSDGRSIVALAEPGSNRRFTRLKWDLAAPESATRWELPGDYGRLSFTGSYRVKLTPGVPLEAIKALRVEFVREIAVHGVEDDRPLLRVEPSGAPTHAAAAGLVLAAFSQAPIVGANGEQTDDSYLEIWEVASGERLLRMPRGFWKNSQGHEAWPMALTPDGRTIAVARGETIVLRDVDSGNDLLRRQAGGDVYCLSFSADSRWLASGQDNGAVLVWDVAQVTRRQPAARPLSDAQLESAWSDLAKDARTSRQAMETLAADPARTVALFRVRLKPAEPIEPGKLCDL
jgi:WD40 repeat protein